MSADLSAMFESTMSKVQAGGHVKRKLTTDEHKEFAGTSLLRRKATMLKEKEVKSITKIIQ